MLKGFMSTLLGINLGGEAIHRIGYAGLGRFSEATSNMIGLGVLGNTIKNFKK